MIDVPVEVKDALRDGRLKKNYRIIVVNDAQPIELKNYGAIYAPQSAMYRFYSPVAGFDFGLMIGIDQGGYWEADPTETEIIKDFYIEAGTRILAYSPDLEAGEIFMQMFINPESYTLDNNNLVSESVSIDERMNSGDKIKFGLCEGSSLEFQYFGRENLVGKHVQVFCDVDYGGAKYYSIPMGFFDVKKCSRQASTGIIKATAYNKLQSEYLDAKANDLIIETYNNMRRQTYISTVSYNVLLSSVLGEYRIKDNYESFDISFRAGVPSHAPDGYTYRKYARVYFPQYDENGNFLGDDKWINLYSPCISALSDVGDIPLTYGTLEGYSKFVFDLSILRQQIEGYLEESFNKSLDEIYVNSSGKTFREALNEIYGDAENAGFKTYPFDNGQTGTPDYRISLNSGNLIETPPIQNVKENGRINDGSFGEFPFIPGYVFVGPKGSPGGEPASVWNEAFERSLGIVRTIKYEHRLLKFDDDIGNQTVDINALTANDVTLRELQSSIFETECQFGQLDRESDLFRGVELNNSRLYPQETLYPDNALYPEGAQASATKSMYSKLWADEGNIHKWRNLIITYKGLDDQQQEQDFVYTAEINSDGTDDYVCSDNWLFRNLVWTQAQIEEYADTMVSKMQDMTWFPFEMWCAGLPYLETGDEIEIPMGQNSYTSYVLQRQLKGIQNLQDTYINGTLDIF